MLGLAMKNILHFSAVFFLILLFLTFYVPRFFYYVSGHLLLPPMAAIAALAPLIMVSTPLRHATGPHHYMLMLLY